MGTRGYNRSDRVADSLQRALAELIMTEVEDPKARAVTVSGIDLSRDLNNARVLVTPPSGADVAATLEALNRATGFLRHRLASRVRMRYVPRLRFDYDPTLDRAGRIDALLDGTLGDPAGGEQPPRDREDH